MLLNQGIGSRGMAGVERNDVNLSPTFLNETKSFPTRTVRPNIASKQINKQISMETKP